MTGLPAIDELIERGALFVVSHSGGKDSQAMLIKLLERVPPAQLLVVHASLGASEWHGALEQAQGQAEAAGLPFLVARARKSFLDMVEHRFKVRPGPNSSCWPSATNRQCTSDLKRGPIEREVRRYVKAKGFSAVVSCMGMRAAESPARAKRPVMQPNKRNTIRGREWWEWLPIHEMPTAEVWHTIAAAGQVPHPAYLAGNQRLSCVFCILASPRDLANGARHRPELFERYREVEQRTGYTMHQSRRSLAELVEQGRAELQRERFDLDEPAFLDGAGRTHHDTDSQSHD
ncbi:phosphoadenosine phosphosulfate reductase family protein [Xanthomonas translucens pv. translucens]|uniref:phosphoadenosine phosphosulfate reductase domain-containing protein n=1 Tax=Xanthomonas campestris pv. translucens TaxID=343 RepID=UPI003F71AD91